MIAVAFGAVVTLLLGWLFSWRVFDGFEIASVDNVPTLAVGDRMLARSTDSPERGDLVVYVRTEDGRESVARVVAIEGDTVAAVRGWLIVNGERYEEP